MKTGECILFVHQSADLYGSDRVLLDLLLGLKRRKYNPVLLLPCDGPLIRELKNTEIEYHIVPLFRVGRSTLSAKGMLSMPFRLVTSLSAISRVMRGRRISLVHSNTLAVISGAFWAKLKGIPHIWHVHEIIEKPLVIRKSFALLLSLLSDKVICNSNATAHHLFLDQPRLSKKSCVVWNGISSGYYPGIEDDAIKVRMRVGVNEGQILVVLIGRVNRWKGQRLLVGAANDLYRRGYDKVHYLFVGDAPSGQEYFLTQLKNDIAVSPASENITLMPFVNNVWPIWHACDIAVVPSTEPEPFGMVALEAMISGKPLVVARHGGLKEIIVNKNTGYLFEPGNVRELADALEALIGDKDMRNLYGGNGQYRAKNIFSLDNYISGVADCYDELFG